MRSKALLLLNLRPLTLLLVLLSHSIISAQNKRIVLDVETYRPIPYVNIYTTRNKAVHATTSDTSGEFKTDFFFKSLNFSHINYEQREILRKNVGDTIFLTPRTNLIGEIVITSKQPDWIINKLKQFRKTISKTYCTTEKEFSYQYKTNTLNDSSGYAFKSKGEIIVPKLKNNALFRIRPNSNVIHYKDSSAGVDFSNMQRILYDDFVADFDKRFIKEHEFKQNHAYKGKNQNIVQLMFNSKKFDSDEGYIVMDTASCAVLEVERSTGTKFNIKRRTSNALRAVASQFKGFKYEEWNIYNYTRYENCNDSYYPMDCKYKFYMKSSTKKKHNSYFVSIESSLSLADKQHSSSNKFIDLPRPYYMLLIKSKKMRLNEERLRNVSVTRHCY